MSSSVSRKKSSMPAVPSARDPFVAMQEEMNDLISRFWQGKPESTNGLTMNPAMDVSENENAFDVRVDAPGMAAKDFDIQVQGNAVVVSGKRHEEHEEDDKKFHRVERRWGSFSRAITLPCEVNEDEVVAQYDSGVLTLTLPKSEKNRARKIDVKQ